MIVDLNCAYMGDGIYAFKAIIKGLILKTIVEASCLSKAREKADCNFKQALFKNGLQFGRGGLEWNMKVNNFSDEELNKSIEKVIHHDKVWYVDVDENGKIIPKKIDRELMTQEEAKKYALSLIFK